MRPMDVATLGRRIPWKMGPLDEASLTDVHRSTCRDKSFWWEGDSICYLVNGKLCWPPKGHLGHEMYPIDGAHLSFNFNVPGSADTLLAKL